MLLVAVQAMAIQNKLQSSSLRPNPRSVFAAIDTNNDGYITSAELTTYWDLVDMPWIEADRDESMTLMDHNQDGKVTFEEFIS